METNQTRKKSAALAVLTTALVCILALILVGCGSTSNAGGDTSTSPQATSQVTSPAAGKAELIIIHTNDTHGFDQATDTSLGMAAAAQLKADYEAEGYNVLLLDAGDAFEGNVLADDSKGKAITRFMNECGYDAMTLGNHEFDYGSDVLEQRVSECEFPVLCANIIVEATGKPFTQPNATFELSNGLKVGVFGIDTPETETKSATKNTMGLDFVQGDELYACAQAQIDELRAQGCDLVICLGHLGEEESSQPNRASDVIANTKGIDLFIDGHDHQIENTTVKDTAGNDVPVVETGCYLANIGVITYANGAFTESMVAVGEYDGSDATVAADIDAVAADIDARLDVKIAEAPFALSGERSPGVRDREAAMGDLVTDAIRWEAKQALGDEPDAAVLNGGAVRAGIEDGDVTLLELLDAYPYTNQVCTVKVTGAQLLEALEAACQGSPEPMGSFPQVSGITFTLDLSVPYENGEQYPYSTYYAPANPGARVTISDVNDKGFDPDATYLLATTDFVATGGDTYYCLAKAAADNGVETTGYLVYEAMRYYLEDECDGTIPDQYAEPQGRITVLGLE